MSESFKSISSTDVVRTINVKDLITNLEKAYVNLDKYVLPPRFFTDTRDGGDYLVAAATNLTNDRYIVRGSSYSPWRKPAISGHFMLSNFDTGELLAVVDGTEVINFRTGAKSAVAAKYLAKKDSRTLGLIGLGASAKIHAEAICSVLPIEKIIGYSRNPEKWTEQREYIKTKTGIEVEIVDLDKIKSESDIIVLSTWTDSPILNETDLKPGQLLISTAHSEEVSKTIPERIKTFVDRFETAKGELGPVKLAIADGASDSIMKGELRDLVTGKIKGRESDEEIIYFQSLGCTHEDMVVIEYVYDHLK